MYISKHTRSVTEGGSALVYILIAIALLAALTIAFMEPSSQQTQSQNNFKVISEISSQVEFIRSTVQECVLVHPSGDNTVDVSGGGTDPGANFIYPLKPDSTHLVDPVANRYVREIRCPGNPGDNNDHAPIFSGASGKYLPPPPSLFGEWHWYNGNDGVFFWIATDKTDSYIQTALDKLDASYSMCEADVIRTSGTDVDLDSDGEDTCVDGSTCFRVWMITKPSATYQVPAEDTACAP